MDDRKSLRRCRQDVKSDRVMCEGRGYKKESLDKLVDMIKQYKDLRHTIEQSGWGTGLNGLDEISHEDRELQTGSCKTAKEFILKCCAWYYKYKGLFSDHPGVNPLALIESE